MVRSINFKAFPLVASVLLVLALGAFSSDVFAAKNAAAIAENVEENIVAFKSLALSIAFLAGIVLVIVGLVFLYKDSKESGRGHAKNGLIAIAIGSALLIVDVLVDYTAGSIIEGEDASSSIQQESGF